MTEPTAIHSTFVLERNYPVAPDKVFAALSDPAKKRRWFAHSDNFDTAAFDMEFRVGGTEHASYRFKPESVFPGAIMTNDATYQDIVPERRVVLSYRMTLADRCISASLVTFELLPTGAGTDLIMTHQGAFFEGSDGPEMREGGWRTLLGKLAECLPAE